VTSIDDPSRQSEIQQLEHDLANLQRRYKALEQSVRILRFGFYGFIIIIIVLIGWAAVVVGNGDLAGALVIPIIILVIAASLGPRALRPGLMFLDRKPRWIDVVGWKPPGVVGVSVKRTEAMAIEDMIADRQRRLAAFGAEPPQAENRT
jgi:hypothetical protein